MPINQYVVRGGEGRRGLFAVVYREGGCLLINLGGFFSLPSCHVHLIKFTMFVFHGIKMGEGLAREKRSWTKSCGDTSRAPLKI